MLGTAGITHPMLKTRRMLGTAGTHLMINCRNAAQLPETPRMLGTAGTPAAAKTDGMGSLAVNFTLAHGYLPSTPLIDMGQVYHRSLQSALDDCAAIGPCAALTFRADEPAGRAEGGEGVWYSIKRYPPGGAPLPTVWPHESWRTYVRVGPPPVSVPRQCDAHECAGIQPPCSPTSPPQWGWVYRAASASAFPRKLAFLHTGSGEGLQVYWHDGVSDSRFLHLLPGGRQDVTTYSGTIWRVRRPPPSNELIHEYVASRLLLQHCECAAQLAPLNLDAAALSVVANAALIADGYGEGDDDGDGDVGEGGRNGGHARGPAPVLCYPPKPVGDSAVEAAAAADAVGAGVHATIAEVFQKALDDTQEVDRLDLHFFNVSPFPAKLVRFFFF
jgi:hypothetical protein